MMERTPFSIATLQKRTVAFVIDDIAVSLFFLAIFYDQITLFLGSIPLEQQSDTQAILEQMNQFVVANILPLFTLKVLYHTILVWQNGMTLGKYLMKIKVVTLDGYHNLSFQSAFFRALLRIPSETFFYLGFILAFFSPLRQTFHDKFSNSVVVDA